MTRLDEIRLKCAQAAAKGLYAFSESEVPYLLAEIARRDALLKECEEALRRLTMECPYVLNCPLEGALDAFRPLHELLTRLRDESGRGSG